MRNKLLKFGNVRFWISFLIILLVVLNLIMFKIYQEAHPSENLSIQLWKYFESATFKVIVASLILPILLFLLESRFKIAETMKKNRLERARKIKQERKEKCLEGITLTLQMWNQLYDLVSEVRYFHKKTKEDPRIKEILQKLAYIGSSGEDVVNIWHFRFDLSSKDQDLFLEFINILLHFAMTVAYYIEKSDNTKECVDLQNSLGVIQEGITTIAHHPIISVLKYYMELLELKEDRAPSDEVQEIDSALKNDLMRLKNWAQAIKREEMRYNKILPAIEGEEVEAYREAAKKVEKWVREHPEEPVNECEEFSNFRDLFYKISHEEFVYAANISYSKEFIRHLADWLGFQSEIQNVASIAKWPE